MTRPGILVVALVAFASVTELRAQGSTGDALVALARGDYDAAARILKPTAESDTSSDTAAQFLMATLYEAGRGVPMDRLHACALYHRASVNMEAPFGDQASRLMRAMFLAQGVEWFADCQALANLGFDHRFEPVTFDLASGHSVAWDLRGATVTYRGQTKPFPMRLGMRGAAFLPLLQTTLNSNGTPSARRHFVEVFVWQPAGDTWTLAWHLFEIIGDELVQVTVEPALLKRTRRPPPSDPMDPRALVTVRTNEAGLAEWAILVAGRERRGTIVRR